VPGPFGRGGRTHAGRLAAAPTGAKATCQDESLCHATEINRGGILDV
jgi:hypothetical protein